MGINIDPNLNACLSDEASNTALVGGKEPCTATYHEGIVYLYVVPKVGRAKLGNNKAATKQGTYTYAVPP